MVTFQQMIVLADKDGMVDMTPEAISRRTSIPLDIIELGIAELMKPDPRSRTPDEDGRRIVLLEDHRDWGWHIVNHAKYQAIRKAEERREYLRNAQAERRARIKSTHVNNVNKASAKVNTSTPVSVSASVDTKREDSGPAQALAPPTAFFGENASAIAPRARALLHPDFQLPEDWGRDAEKLGWEPARILKESEKFRQYWVAGKGQGSRKSVRGWRQSWSNWLSKAERFA